MMFNRSNKTECAFFAHDQAWIKRILFMYDAIEFFFFLQRKKTPKKMGADNFFFIILSFCGAPSVFWYDRTYGKPIDARGVGNVSHSSTEVFPS